MKEIRFHGRGGQGAVVASRLIAWAAFLEGKNVQSFPFFGVERRGAPVLAFTRISEKPIRVRTEVRHPDHVVILDPTLVDSQNVLEGLKGSGIILINTNKPASSFEFSRQFKTYTIDATSIASKFGLGAKSNPIVNTTVLGSFARVTGEVSIDSVVRAIEEGAPAKKEANIEAAREAYEKTKC